MISQDQIAAATIAQIFGGELLSVQENARTDSGNTPQVVKMHPRDFLGSANVPNKAQHDKAQQQRLLESLQREAEAACPLPEPIAPPPPVPQQAPQRVVQQTSSAITFDTNNSHVMERIAVALERISARLEAIEFTATKKKKKRVKPSEPYI